MRAVSRYGSAHSKAAPHSKENERALEVEYEKAREAYESALVQHKSTVAMTETMLSAGFDAAHLQPEFAAETRAQILLAVAAQRLEGFRVALERHTTHAI